MSRPSNLIPGTYLFGLTTNPSNRKGRLSIAVVGYNTHEDIAAYSPATDMVMPLSAGITQPNNETNELQMNNSLVTATKNVSVWIEARRQGRTFSTYLEKVAKETKTKKRM